MWKGSTQRDTLEFYDELKEGHVKYVGWQKIKVSFLSRPSVHLYLIIVFKFLVNVILLEMMSKKCGKERVKIKEPIIFDEISDIILSLLVINSYFFVGTIL